MQPQAAPPRMLPMTQDIKKLFLHSFVLAKARMPFMSGKRAVRQAIEAWEAIEKYSNKEEKA